jgi:hypothetical protein
MTFFSRTTFAAAALLGALSSTGCQTGSTSSEPGLITVDACEECRPAYEDCLAAGRDDCEPMMQECFAECPTDQPEGPNCGCDGLFDSCMAAKREAEDCEPNDQPDGACDPGTGEQFECEQIYQQCAAACDVPVPPSPCEECDGILRACFEEAQASDDPIAILSECAQPYVECQLECQLDRDPPTGDDGDICPCDVELESCLDSGEEEGGCFERYEECTGGCVGDGDDEDQPGQPGDDEDPTDWDCWESFEECAGDCGDGQTTREECEERLNECMQ